MFHVKGIKIFAVNEHEENELYLGACNRMEGIQSYLLMDKERHIAGNLRAMQTGPILYLFVNMKQPAAAIRYEFPQKRSENLSLTSRPQSCISSGRYFIHAKAGNDNAVYKMSELSGVSVTVPEEAEIIVGRALTDDRLLRLLKRVEEEPRQKAFLEKLCGLS